MKNEKLIKKTVSNPGVQNYIRDLPWKGWAQVRSLASEMGRSRLVLKQIDKSQLTVFQSQHRGTAKDFKIPQNTAELERVDLEASLGET